MPKRGELSAFLGGSTRFFDWSSPQLLAAMFVEWECPYALNSAKFTYISEGISPLCPTHTVIISS